MNKNLTYLLNTLALAIVPATASGATDCVPANTVEWESTKGGNGHFYEVIVADGIDWDTANALANDRFCNGVQGHLATLTSADEDTFVDERRDATPGINKTGGFFDSELWVGGFQPDGSAEPAGGWTWVNDEGLFDFTNWLAGEPNNAGAGESHLAIGLNNLDGWNDEGNLDGIFGYVVEYDGTATAEECLEECNPSGVQKVQLPASFVPQPGDELTQFIRLQGPDPRVDALGQCFDRRFLDVFEHFEPANVAMHGKLILPPHLCGSRDIIVVESNANFLVLSDVVRSEQIPEEVVTEFFPCLGALGDTELQRRGVFAWQTDNRFDLIERHTIELTNGCDSSRGSTRQLSFFVLNLHIDCGIAFDSNPEGVRHCFSVIVNAKFIALNIALSNARSSLISPRLRNLRRPLVKAQLLFNLGRFDDAIAQLNIFIDRADGGIYDSSDGFNDEGNLLMRAENIAFTIGKLAE